jgi:hypothetical protein
MKSLLKKHVACVSAAALLGFSAPAFACPNGWSGNPCRPGLGNDVRPPRGKHRQDRVRGKDAQPVTATTPGPNNCRMKSPPKPQKKVNPRATGELPPGPPSNC